jgi:hypothetical protein
MRWALPILAVPALGGVLLVALWGYDRWANTVPPFRPPSVRFPSPNGYDRAAALTAKLPAEPWLELPRWPQGSPKQLRDVLRPHRRTLDAIHDTFALEWRAPLPLSDLAPSQERVLLYEWVPYFAAAGILARVEGDHGLALDRALDVLELAGKATRGAPILDSSKSVAAHSMGFHLVKQFWRAVPAAAVPDALARVRRVQSSWSSFAEILEAERVSTLAETTWIYQGAYQHQTPVSTLRCAGDIARTIRDDPSQMKQSLRLWLTPKRHVLQNQDRYLRQVITESKKPFWQQRSIPLPADDLSQTGLWPHAQMEECQREFAGVQTDLALLEVALAVRMHRLERGRYPARLEEISRRWLPAVPRQADGTQIGYELRGGKPVVYSLGGDGKRRVFGERVAASGG